MLFGHSWWVLAKAFTEVIVSMTDIFHSPRSCQDILSWAPVLCYTFLTHVPLPLHRDCDCLTSVRAEIPFIFVLKLVHIIDKNTNMNTLFMNTKSS